MEGTDLLQTLADHGTPLSGVLHALEALELAALRASSAFLREHVKFHAMALCDHIVRNNPLVRRWRSADEDDSLRTLRELELSIAYFQLISGGYNLGSETVLELSPEGDFVNFSTAHKFSGSATIAKLASTTGRLGRPLPSTEYFFFLDRWYTACLYEGVSLSDEDLEFVGPGLQCYSVTTYGAPERSPAEAQRERGLLNISSGEAQLFENTPCPTSDRGWDVPLLQSSIQEGRDSEETYDGERAQDRHLRPLGQKVKSWEAVLLERAAAQSNSSNSALENGDFLVNGRY